MAVDATPRVSVIIPAFNAAQFITGALDSVLAQTLSNIEVIVIDDASTDDTCQIVSKYMAGDTRVRLLQNAANSGPAYSRNQGINAAKAEWIALLDADDWYDKHRLEVLLTHATQHNLDFIADDQWRIEQKGDKPYATLLPQGYLASDWGMLTLNEYLLRNPPGQNNAFGLLKPLLRRSFLKENNISYNENLRLGEDFFLYLEMLAANARAGLIAKAYYYYASRPGSLTGIRRRVDIERMLQGLELILQSRHIQRKPDILKQLNERKDYIRRYQLPLVDLISSLKGRRFIMVLGVLSKNPQVFPELVKRFYRYMYRMTHKLH